MVQIRAHRGGLFVGLLLTTFFFSQACTVSDSAVYADRGETTDSNVLAVVGGTEITAEEVAELLESEARVASLSPSKAMVETFLVGGRVLRDLIADPLLPEPIVNRSARRALVAAMIHYDRIGRAQWALFLAHFDAPHMKTRHRPESELRIQ